jgi:hypothetical protein
MTQKIFEFQISAIQLLSIRKKLFIHIFGCLKVFQETLQFENSPGT